MRHFIFFALWLTTVAAHATTDPLPNVRIERIARYQGELARLTAKFEAGDLVIFDLDNTVFRETQMLGTDEWYSDAVHELQKQGLTKREAAAALEDLNVAIKWKTRMKLMEPGIPALIADLQARGVYVIGLTARHPRLAPSTLKHLKELGIAFHPEAWRLHAPEMENDLLYEGGVAFTDGAVKGQVLKHILLDNQLQPRRVAAIDDRIHHVESYVETVQELGLHAVLIHYLGVLEHSPYEPAVGRLQAQVFNKLGLLLSDEEARDFVAGPPWPQTKSWRCSRLLLE